MTKECCFASFCAGTMQTLDARHLELFLHEEYKNGTWEYEEIGSRPIQKQCIAASGGIFDVKYLHSPTLSGNQLLISSDTINDTPSVQENIS